MASVNIIFLFLLSQLRNPLVESNVFELVLQKGVESLRTPRGIGSAHEKHAIADSRRSSIATPATSLGGRHVRMSIGLKHTAGVIALVESEMTIEWSGIRDAPVHFGRKERPILCVNET